MQLVIFSFYKHINIKAHQLNKIHPPKKKDYDISFLVTNHLMQQLSKNKLIDFIIQLIEDVNKEISEIKLDLNSRARIVAQNVCLYFT